MFSKLVIFGVGMACSAVAFAAPRLGASPVSVKFGSAIRWSHAKLRVKTTSTAHWKSGFAIASVKFARHGEWSGDSATEVPRGESLIGILWQTNSTYNAEDNAPHFSENLDGDGTNIAAIADVTGPMQGYMRGFLRNLAYSRAWQWCTDVEADALLEVPISVSTAQQKAEWLFGRSVDNVVRDGAVLESGAVSFETSNVQDIDLDRPAIDLTVQLAFELNPYIALFVEGGYGFVFGKPVEKKDMVFAGAAEKDATVKTLLGKDMLVRGGLGFLSFTNSSGRMFSGVKTETSLKEGWKVFAGFNYTPDPSLFVGFGVGLKEYKVSVDVTRGTFHYPYSELYRGNLSGTDAFDVKPSVKLHFEKNIYPLALRATFGAIVKSIHTFSVGLEYVSTKADLNASAKDIDASSSTKDKDSKDSKKDRAVYNEEYTLPTALVTDAVTVDDFQARDGFMHMTDADKVTVKHSARVELTDISLALSYQLKL